MQTTGMLAKGGERRGQEALGCCKEQFHAQMHEKRLSRRNKPHLRTPKRNDAAAFAILRPPCCGRLRKYEGGNMPKHVCFVVGVVAVIGALAARPAKAADDIASKAQACAACHGENGVP